MLLLYQKIVQIFLIFLKFGEKIIFLEIVIYFEIIGFLFIHHFWLIKILLICCLSFLKSFGFIKWPRWRRFEIGCDWFFQFLLILRIFFKFLCEFVFLQKLLQDIVLILSKITLNCEIWIFWSDVIFKDLFSIQNFILLQNYWIKLKLEIVELMVIDLEFLVHHQIVF